MKSNVYCVFCKHSYFVSHPCVYEKYVTIECEYFYHLCPRNCELYEKEEYDDENSDSE